MTELKLNENFDFLNLSKSNLLLQLLSSVNTGVNNVEEKVIFSGKAFRFDPIRHLSQSDSEYPEDGIVLVLTTDAIYYFPPMLHADGLSFLITSSYQRFCLDQLVLCSLLHRLSNNGDYALRTHIFSLHFHDISKHQENKVECSNHLWIRCPEVGREFVEVLSEQFMDKIGCALPIEQLEMKECISLINNLDKHIDHDHINISLNSKHFIHQAEKEITEFNWNNYSPIRQGWVSFMSFKLRWWNTTLFESLDWMKINNQQLLSSNNTLKLNNWALRWVALSRNQLLHCNDPTEVPYFSSSISTTTPRSLGLGLPLKESLSTSSIMPDDGSPKIKRRYKSTLTKTFLNLPEMIFAIGLNISLTLKSKSQIEYDEHEVSSDERYFHLVSKNGVDAYIFKVVSYEALLGWIFAIQRRDIIFRERVLIKR